MMKSAREESSSTTLAPIEDAWLANVFEVQISDEGRVFSFVPPDEMRRAMELLVQSEMLASLLPSRR